MMTKMVTKPLRIYETETKEYKIVVSKQLFDTHRPITNKNYLARYYNYEFDDIGVTTTNTISFNMYKWVHPIYSIRLESYTDTPLLRSTVISDIKYNGAFFSIMNRIRDEKSITYSFDQGGSKKLSKFLIKRRRSNAAKIFRTQGIQNRFDYEQGSGGIFYILCGDIKRLLKSCPKYELRRIMSVIRRDYYKLMRDR